MTLQPLVPGMTVYCPVCGTTMVHKPRHHFWQCPTCRIELWPPVLPTDPDFRTPEELFQAMSRPPGGLIKRGSGNSSGRKRKKPRKRCREEDPEK